MPDVCYQREVSIKNKLSYRVVSVKGRSSQKQLYTNKFIMLCCLCLKDSENITRIFEDGGANGGHNIAIIVAKHFCWFEVSIENFFPWYIN